MSGITASLDGVKRLAMPVAIIFCLLQFVPPRVTAPGPVADIMASAPWRDRMAVKGLFAGLRRTIELDGGREITSSEMWRGIYNHALLAAVDGTPLAARYPGMKAAIDATLAKHYDLTNKEMDTVLVAKIVSACNDIEAQCE